MRQLALAFIALAAVATASELYVGVAQGNGIRTFTGAPGARYSMQCPNLDGGGGQRVYYRPGCPTRADGGVTCVVDAGLGDVIVDFTQATGVQDAYKIDLAPNEDRIHVGNADSYANASFCTFARRSP